MSPLNPPKIFVSYSWDDEDHRSWVLEFATRLRVKDGVDVTLDQWHAVPGDQLPRFMATAVRESDYVLLVCTPRYKLKADGGEGGVGYEGDIITGEVLSLGNQRKFIPVLRRGSWDQAAPSGFSGKYYIDLTETPYSEQAYRGLLDTLHGTRKAPPQISRLAEPNNDQAVVVIDEAHGQGRWRHLPPTAGFGYSMAASLFSSCGTVRPHKEGPLEETALERCSLLVIPMPFGTLMSSAEYEYIAHWVYRGGSLLICGFYFMEAHLYTNFSALARLFQIDFGRDLIMPLGRTTRDDALAQAFPIKPALCAFTEIEGSAAEHPILKGIRKVALQSSCSVYGTGQGDDVELEMRTGTGVSNLAPKTGERNAKTPEKFDIVYTYEASDAQATPFLVAKGHGKGRVVAAGSWRIFIDDYMADDSVDNARLLKNCIDWLCETQQDATQLANWELGG